MKKIIVVAFHLGRVGSSAVMGLLNLSGINVGKAKNLIGPKPMNPKGFFELKSQQKFLEKVYTGIYPDITDPPSLESLDRIGKEYYPKYDQLIRTEFENRFPASVKSQRFLTLPFLYRLKEQYNIKVLVVERNPDDQLNSIIKIWKKSGNTYQKNASREFIRGYIKKWKSFTLLIEKHYDLSFFHVSFDELMARPLKTSQSIFNFIQEKCPTKQQITDWLDQSLVNRD